MDNIFRTDSPRPKIKIVNGECVNVLKRIPNESVDLLITDPPYRTTSRGNAGNSGGMLQKDINKKRTSLFT